MIFCILELQMTSVRERSAGTPSSIHCNRSFFLFSTTLYFFVKWHPERDTSGEKRRRGPHTISLYIAPQSESCLLGCKRLLLPPLTIKSQSLYLKVYHWYRNKSFPLDRIISVDGEKKHWRCSDEGEQIKSCFFSCHKIVIVSTSLKGIMLFSRKKIISRERKMFLDGLQLWQ